jgi:predicted phosphoribosyltransferase
VIVVDDWLAMGTTMRATLRALRVQQPALLIAAVPVGTRETCDDLRKDADAVVCWFAPETMSTVGAFYEDFQQVADETVHQILRDFAMDAPFQSQRSLDQEAMTTEPSA